MPDLTMQSPPKRLLQDLKVLSEIVPGDIIEMRGDLLQPFCSHVLYRVRVTANQRIGQDCRRIIGVLIDFKDSEVVSYAIKEERMFRVEREHEEH
jgi:hypothetical protein